jgi:hypothetical protein
VIGQKVYQQKTTPDVREIDVRTWRTGVYVANTKSNQQVYIQKLIIK